MGGRRRSFEERRSWFSSFLIVLAGIIGREIQRHLIRQRRAIASLERIRLLIAKVDVAEKLQGDGSVRSGKSAKIADDGIVELGGSAVGMGNCRP